ncbi:ribonuclease H-like domain-containing protein [Lentinula raphanica]|nr:ribonuclease H-like domain-containing protein [Lentinula raphanica]
MPNFALCNTPFSVIAAVSLLNASPALIVDCEALQLGTRGGILSLISIRSISPKPSYCYLFDALALSSSYLQPLFNLLTNPNILKVFYDGRRDWCAFYYTYKVRIRNVLDLQLVDLTSRFMRGEGTAQQRQRLLRLFTLEQIKQNEAKFAHVHVLNGLAASLKEHVFLYKRPLGLNKQRVDHDDWLIRPLPIDYLHYAAQDVEIIHVLYAYFIQAGYITRNPFLFSQSEHYISLWSDAIPEPDDVYRANPLLPLEILQIPELSVTSSSPSFLCQGCSRALSLSLSISNPDCPRRGYSVASVRSSNCGKSDGDHGRWSNPREFMKKCGGKRYRSRHGKGRVHGKRPGTKCSRSPG